MATRKSAATRRAEKLLKEQNIRTAKDINARVKSLQGISRFRVSKVGIENKLIGLYRVATGQKTSIEKYILETLDQVNNLIGQDYERVFGNGGAQWQNWLENPTGAIQQSARAQAERELMARSNIVSQFERDVRSIYTNYWQQKSTEIDTFFPWGNYRNIQDYRQSTIYRRKKARDPALVVNMPGGFRRVRSVRPTRMSGFLRESVLSAIAGDNVGNSGPVLDLDVSPFGVSSSFNPDNFPIAPRHIGNAPYIYLFMHYARGGYDERDLWDPGQRVSELVIGALDQLANNVRPELFRFLRRQFTVK